MSAEIKKYEIISKDNRKNYCKILYNNLINTAFQQQWNVNCNGYEDSKETCEIDFSKDINAYRITFKVQIIVYDTSASIIIEKTSLYEYGLLAFFQMFFSSIDNKIFKKITKKENSNTIENVNNIDIILNVMSNFHKSSQQLLRRYNNRPTIEMNDEYDVQDYLHSILLLFFDDIRREDPIPKSAGASSRVDFFIPKEKLAIETKFATEKVKDKELGEQLSVDIQRYQGNKNIETIIFFIYDPNYCIKNPIALERDFANNKNVKVIVKIVPK